MPHTVEPRWRTILRAVRRTVVYLLCVVILVAVVGANLLAPRFEGILTIALGGAGHKVENPGGEDTVIFTSSYDSEEGRTEALTAVSTDVSREGITLLSNENKSLPLTSSAKVTLLGQDSVDPVHGGGGAGSVDASKAVDLRTGLEAAGLTVNPVTWDFYTSGPGKDYRKTTTDVYGAGAFAVNEVPASLYTSEFTDSFAEYPDAAIVLIGRSGGESADLPTTSDADGRLYLQLSQNELDLLELARESFDKVVVVLNTQNAMDVSELDEIGVDSVLWVGGLGLYGATALGEVLTGVVNPSGALVDVHATDSLSAPANANLGNYVLTNSQVASGSTYMVYSEGVYVGYRYYETRYEDVVLGQGNAGDFDHAAAVQYPFGFGLSYTTFEWGTAVLTPTDDGWRMAVTVTNTGDVAGKDIVQLYLNAPYTEYDREVGIERPAIQLVGFAKTGELAPGASEDITIDVPREALRVWDSGADTWILEAGTYHLAFGTDSHDALNNALAAKGFTTADGMDAEGNADLASQVTVAATETIASATGEVATSQFADVDLRTYDESWTPLSRSDWTGTWPTTWKDGAWEAPSALLADLEIDPTPSSDGAGVVTSTVDEILGRLTAYDLIGKDYNDPAWDALVGQMSVAELDTLVRIGGYQTAVIPSVALPGTTVKDGSAGISSTLVGGASGMAYPPEVVLGSAWNLDLARAFGEGIGEDSLALGVTGWYAPSLNIHRSPYSGRNFEYWSEDPALSGRMTAAVVEGARSKGVTAWMKHYALNDQETNRIGVATFADEQTVREIYLTPFEVAVRDGGANAMMTALNRVGARWAGGHEGLMTSVLREEWGFQGAVVTDQASFSNFVYEDLRQGLAAGTSLWLNTDSTLWKLTEAEMTDAVIADMQKAAKDIMFTVVNSNAMNNVGPDSTVKETIPAWKSMLWTASAVLIVGVIVLIYFDRRGVRKRKARRAALAAGGGGEDSAALSDASMESHPERQIRN